MLRDRIAIDIGLVSASRLFDSASSNDCAVLFFFAIGDEVMARYRGEQTGTACETSAAKRELAGVMR